MGQLRLSKGENRAHARSDRAALDEAGDHVQTLRRHIDEEERRADPVAGCLGLVGNRNGRDQRAARLQNGEGAALSISAHQIDYRVDTADLPFELTGLEVDHIVDPKFVEVGDILGSARRDNPQPGLPRELNRERTNVPCRAVDQHGVPAL